MSMLRHQVPLRSNFPLTGPTGEKLPRRVIAVAHRALSCDVSGCEQHDVCTLIWSDLGFRTRSSGLSATVCLAAQESECPRCTPGNVKPLLSPWESNGFIYW
ncbi:hypothetical protein THIOKS11100004 [Thiocapsa sp. KS1]|nr:hypothetical protein THIOKS11100004 [Thiocapsa sp. KS1]